MIDPFTAARPQDYVMRRVERSDVWHLTVRMPRDARFIYRVSVNDQTGPGFFGDLKLGRCGGGPFESEQLAGSLGRRATWCTAATLDCADTGDTRRNDRTASNYQHYLEQ